MNKTLTFVAGLVIGLVTGSATSIYICKKMCKKKMEETSDQHLEEINEIIARNQERIFNATKPDKEEPEDKKEPETAEKVNYGNFADHSADNNPLTTNKEFEYVSPSEIGEDELYSVADWTVYTDGYVLDELDEIVDGPEEYIGDALNHFGEFDEDIAYVKNNVYKIYYTIERMDEAYQDKVKTMRPNKQWR